jgi:hypothetical protein
LNRFPAQEQINGSSKIPTVLYYSTDGKVRAVGAEAMSEGIYEQAEDEGWIKVEWYVHGSLKHDEKERSEMLLGSSCTCVR